MNITLKTNAVPDDFQYYLYFPNPLHRHELCGSCKVQLKGNKTIVKLDRTRLNVVSPQFNARAAWLAPHNGSACFKKTIWFNEKALAKGFNFPR